MIKAENLKKRYGNVVAVDDVRFERNCSSGFYAVAVTAAQPLKSGEMEYICSLRSCLAQLQVRGND